MANFGSHAIDDGCCWWQHRGLAWYVCLASQDSAQEVQIWCAGYHRCSTCCDSLLSLWAVVGLGELEEVGRLEKPFVAGILENAVYAMTPQEEGKEKVAEWSATFLFG